MDGGVRGWSGWFLLLSSLCVGGTDWTGWRGPAGNGTTMERGWNPKALDEPRVLWRAEVGTGHAAVVVQGERLFTIGNYLVADNAGEDVVICLDTGTGEEVWAHVYPCAEKEDPGPCSTPLLADGRLYTLSREGHFHCFDAETGEVLWMHHLVEEELCGSFDYFATSPAVFGDLVVLAINRTGMVFDRRTGELVRNSRSVGEEFSSPLVWRSGDEELLVIQRMGSTCGIEPRTGEVRWEIERGFIPDPLFLGSDVVVFDDVGIGRYYLAPTGPELVWNNEDCISDFQSHVVVGDHAYGFARDGESIPLQCLSLETGVVRWRTDVEMGALIAADDKLIVVDKQGHLIISAATPRGFRELSRTRAIDLRPAEGSSRGRRREHACWTNPVLSHGRIYVRSTYGDLTCLDVR